MSDTVQADKKISIEFTLSSEGAQIESNNGAEPLTYIQGQGQLLPGLEKELEGLAVDGTKSVTLTADEGYGLIDPEAFIEVDKSQVPEEAHKVGAQLVTQDPDGNMLQPTVSEIKSDKIVLDFNHPLAGKTLEFDIKILKIEEQ